MKRKIGSIFIVVGAVLLLVALSLMAYNKWDAWRAGQSVATIQDRLEALEEEIASEGKTINIHDKILDEDETGEEATEETIEIDDYEYIGSLSIPRFGLELPVMSEWSYPGLKLAPGRYKGTAEGNDLIICGHNYDRHFGNLKYLEAGEEVTFTDILGNVYEYEVVEVEILQPTAIEDMVNGNLDLTLFTCTIGGQARVTVRCERLENS